MSDDDILKIAMLCDPEFTRRTYYLDLLNFGAAIAAAEREECAKTCEALWQEEATAAANGTQEPKYHDAIECAYAIRLRTTLA